MPSSPCRSTSSTSSSPSAPRTSSTRPRRYAIAADRSYGSSASRRSASSRSRHGSPSRSSARSGRPANTRCVGKHVEARVVRRDDERHDPYSSIAELRAELDRALVAMVPVGDEELPEGRVRSRPRARAACRPPRPRGGGNRRRHLGARSAASCRGGGSASGHARGSRAAARVARRERRAAPSSSPRRDRLGCTRRASSSASSRCRLRRSCGSTSPSRTARRDRDDHAVTLARPRPGRRSPRPSQTAARRPREDAVASHSR